MKKLFVSIFVAALMLLGTRAQAQLVVGGGYLHSIESTKNTSNNTATGNPEHLKGFYLGASYNIPLAGVLGVAPGFYMDMLFQEERYSNGASILGQIISGTATSRYTELAFNVPVNLTLTFEMGSNAKFFAYAGPVFQVGAFSRSTYHGAVQIGPIHYNEGDSYNHYDPEKGDTNLFNIYLGGGVGVQVGDIQFMVGYDHNLLDCDRLDGFVTNRNQIKGGINLAF